jgi:hypothetical protein
MVRRTLGFAAAAAAVAVTSFTIAPAQAAPADCAAGAGISISQGGDTPEHFVKLGQAQYTQRRDVTVTHGSCTDAYTLTIPRLDVSVSVPARTAASTTETLTNVGFSSAFIANGDAGEPQVGTLRFGSGAGSVSVQVVATPLRWTKVSTAAATPQPIDAGGTTRVTANMTIVNWTTNTYTVFRGRLARLRVYQASAGETYLDVTGVIVRGDDNGRLARTVTLGSDTAVDDSIWGVRYTYGGNHTAGFAAAVGGGDPNGVLVRAND